MARLGLQLRGSEVERERERCEDYRGDEEEDLKERDDPSPTLSRSLSFSSLLRLAVIL